MDIFDYLQKNPRLAGLVLAAIGALLLVGAILNWRWVVDTQGERRGFRLLRAIFGVRGEMIITAIVIIAGGVTLFVLL